MKKNASPRIIALTFLVALACGCLLTDPGVPARPSNRS